MAAAGLALAGYPLRRSAEVAPRRGGDAPAAADRGSEARSAARRPHARADLARGLGRRVRALQQRPAHRHHLRRARRAAALPGLRRSAAAWATEVHDRPVGIVFHTSESDIWPLEESFNEKLRDSSQDLLRYLRRNQRLPLPDRPLRPRLPRGGGGGQGQPRRHVGLERRATAIYLNLNDAVARGLVRDALGGRARAADHARRSSRRGAASPTTCATSGRSPPSMCVTHGLASVNPKKHLIGHHLDWARGLPVRGLRAARPVRAGARRRRALRLRVRRPLPDGDGRAVAGGALAAEQRWRRRRRRAAAAADDDAQGAGQDLRPVAGRADHRTRRRREKARGARRTRAPQAEDSNMAENKDHLWKVARGSRGQDRGPGQARARTRWGSTSAPARSWSRGGAARTSACASQLNAFIPVPYSPVTETTIQQQSDIHYYRDGDELDHLRLGHRALREHVQRRVRGGRWRTACSNPKEKQAWPVLEAILAEPGAQGRAPRARCSPSRCPPPRPGREAAAHLPRGHPAPALHLARLQGGGDQRGPGGDLLRARGPATSRASASPAAAACATPRSPSSRSRRSWSASPRAATSSTARWARRSASTRPA